MIALIGSWLHRAALADKSAALAGAELELQAARAEIAILRLSLDLSNAVIQREFSRVQAETAYFASNHARQP